MNSHKRGGGRLVATMLVAALGPWGLVHSSAIAQSPGPIAPNLTQNDPEPLKQLRLHKSDKAGTLGYGAPGLYPGVQGFGLGFHLGYGYGGDSLGSRRRGLSVLRWPWLSPCVALPAAHWRDHALQLLWRPGAAHARES